MCCHPGGSRVAADNQARERGLAAFLFTGISHLLKWQFQPDRRGKNWRLTIREQRRRIERHLEDNPTLKANLDAIVGKVYPHAGEEASDQTDLPENTFPSACPYTQDQILDRDWFPDDDGQKEKP
ncbi:MAG: DUF29 domain-containing protein [Acetobacteraceae bacterium]|nr:DUF29 domain-containing protein [Acetobacteraceae bacterium]MBV8525844.1 DUF29 domain-containing protein [Acetobacteraceae bacterium]